MESMFQIVDKDRQVVPFRLNKLQRVLDDGWSRRNIVPKARQGGVSSYCINRMLAKLLTQRNRVCVVISHEAEATQRLLDRARWTLDNLQEGLRPSLGRNSRGEITFTATDGTLYIGTAGARNFGHGDTISDLHWSEAGRCDAERLVTGLFPAAERGEITIESTGNGRGNWYHRQCQRAREGVGFKLFFFPWIIDPGYALPFDTEGERAVFAMHLKEEWGERELLARGISLEQLRWRRERIEVDFEGSLPEFNEAYPLDFDDCFQSAGWGVFGAFSYQPTDTWRQQSPVSWHLDGHPSSLYHYLAGIDVGGGVGRDRTVCEVFCMERDEQVAEWCSSRVPPGEAGHLIAKWLEPFDAYTNIERNNHGLAFIQEFVDDYPLHLVHKGSVGQPSTQYAVSGISHLGTLTTESNRGLLIGQLRHQLHTGLVVHGEELRSELITFVEKENGRAEADTGCFDDRVMAAAHATLVCDRAGMVMSVIETRPEAEPNPFSFEGLFGEHGTVDAEQGSHDDPLWRYV
jgi:hypothetical protein